MCRVTPVLFVVLVLRSVGIDAQSIAGRYYAETVTDSTKLHYLFDIRHADSTFSGLVDLLSEEKYRRRLDSVFVSSDGQVYLKHEGLKLAFRGAYDATSQELRGTLYRGAAPSAVRLSPKPQARRVQAIADNLPYRSEDVQFYNSDSTRLAGTLTLPEEGSEVPVLVLVSGSGPQNRDSEILGHRPFAVLADYLTRRGVAVLRYDDRGYGASEGRFRPATTLDYADDAEAAVSFLTSYTEASFTKVGILGHSEGGNIAPVVATRDTSIDFVVPLAAPGLSNYASYLLSLERILQAYPETYDRDYAAFESVYADMAAIADVDVLRDSLTTKFTRLATAMSDDELADFGGVDAYVDGNVRQHTSLWFHAYLQFDVTPYLQQLTVPVLALNGDQDDAVTASENLAGIQRTLTEAGNT